jgi:hypothetical protein
MVRREGDFVDVMGGNFLATMMDRWLTNFVEKTDHLSIGRYRPGLNCGSS